MTSASFFSKPFLPLVTSNRTPQYPANVPKLIPKLKRLSSPKNSFTLRQFILNPLPSDQRRTDSTFPYTKGASENPCWPPIIFNTPCLTNPSCSGLSKRLNELSE